MTVQDVPARGDSLHDRIVTGLGMAIVAGEHGPGEVLPYIDETRTRIVYARPFRIDVHHDEYADARAHLDDALNSRPSPRTGSPNPASPRTRSPKPLVEDVVVEGRRSPR